MRKNIFCLSFAFILIIFLSGCIVELGMMARIAVDKITFSPNTTKRLPYAVVGKPYSALITAPGDIRHSIKVTPDNLGLSCTPCMPYINYHTRSEVYSDYDDHGDFSRKHKVIIKGTPIAPGTLIIKTYGTTLPTMIRSSKEMSIIYKIKIIEAKKSEK